MVEKIGLVFYIYCFLN